MNKQKSINFIPIGNYPLKIAGVIILLIGIFLQILQIFKMGELEGIELGSHWIIVLGLCFINFSKEKNESDKILIVRLLSFRIAGIFIVAFILSIDLVSFVFSIHVLLKPIMIAFLYNIVFIVNYLFLIFIVKNETNIAFNETNISENFKANPKIFIYWVILSIISIMLIILF